MNFEENFQNASDCDSINLDDNMEGEFEVIEEEYIKSKTNLNHKFTKSSSISGTQGYETFKDNNSDITEEEDEPSQQDLNHKFKESNTNIKGVEGFRGGEEKKYNDNKLVLKSILFGLLFYLLSNPKIYNLTKPYLNGLDKNLVHSIVFIILFYLINIVI